MAYVRGSPNRLHPERTSLPRYLMNEIFISILTEWQVVGRSIGRAFLAEVVSAASCGERTWALGSPTPRRGIQVFHSRNALKTIE